MILNEYFQQEYLTCGMARDNFIFENCPLELVEIAQTLLNKPAFDVKPCNILITLEDEKQVEKTLSKCLNEYQKNAVTRDYITALIMIEALKGEGERSEEIANLQEGISAILNGDFEKAKRFHLNCPMPNEIGLAMRDVGKIELNVFLVGTQNVYLQRAINNFISCREPYSIKIFSTNEKLPSYRDQAGNMIENPHDYMTRNVNNYIELEEEFESE